MSSLWTNTVEMPEFPKLEKDIRTQVLIVGGGLTGLLCAYFLKQAGVDYCVLESDRICKKITGHTTAKISVGQGLVYEKLFSRFGQEKTALFLKANEKALKNFKSMGALINCDMEEQNAYLYTCTDRRKLEKEMQTLGCLGAGADFVEKTALPFEIQGAIRYRGQAQFHPLKFAAGIARNLKIYEQSEVREMTEHYARTEKGSVAAEKIIIATHFPFINTRGSYFMKLYQQRSYVLALKDAPDIGGMYLQTEEPGLSFRNYGSYLLIGGESHRTGKQCGGWNVLKETAQQYFPDAKEEFCWANQDCMSLDGLPYIGHYSKNTPDLFTASGYNKWGMTGAMIAAMVLSDLVRERDNEYKQLFSPSRNGLRPQLFLNACEAIRGIATIKKGKRCSHMGCSLKWNENEQTWDCPCHGSRFDISGRQLDNPAVDGLKEKRQK